MLCILEEVDDKRSVKMDIEKWGKETRELKRRFKIFILFVFHLK
jgi:hypothetical protein